MARTRNRNPIGFTPWPVTFFICAIFTALFASLISIHHTVPSAPSNLSLVPGVNLTEAWLDLNFLTNGYHPYNSRRNDEVRNWLLQRIESILERNGIHNFTDASVQQSLPAVLFDDVQSNLTFSSRDSALSVAFTGTNIILYIRGSRDSSGSFWNTALAATNPDSYPNHGVLVNAHFDSVPSGFGATDDGIGVVSILQLISHFTMPGNQPIRGIVALLNNGEEDYLNGAYAFSQHPISDFPHTFLNLEGAGAGGRAVLFRTTDSQVTRFYTQAPNPFGSVVTADGFKRGLVRSQTDYVVFNGELGMRGLDVAFMEPRSRYHTVEDSSQYTSENSLWHMLSAGLATLSALTSDTTDMFDGDSSGPGKVKSGIGSDPVWFDLFGQFFVVFDLHSLFAVSVTLLVVTPIIFMGLTSLLVSTDKFYPFTISYSSSNSEKVQIGGLRGFFRTPITYLLSTSAVVGLAFLLAKINPHIVYSSRYSVWSMMLSAWFTVFWFLMCGLDSMRPSVLQRFYTLLWMYIAGWILLAAATVAENNFHLAGGYFLVFYFAAISLALLISYLELFALPKRSAYTQLISNFDPLIQQSSRSQGSIHDVNDDDDEINERTSLLRGDDNRTLAVGYRSSSPSRNPSQHPGSEDEEVYEGLPRPYGREQAWSGKMPSSVWILQFLILGPCPVILIGQVALLITSGLYQTSADGSPVLTIYLFFAVLGVLLLSPVTPFIHRFRFVVPLVLFLIFCATLGYNLLAFPFSDQARLKVYFVQSINLETGINNVSLTGLAPFVQQIAHSIPSAAGQELICSDPDYSARAGLTKCSWQGPLPNLMPEKASVLSEHTFSKLVNFTASPTAYSDKSKSSYARIYLSAINTRACRLIFDRPITHFEVDGYATDSRFPVISKHGCQSIRLWNREWKGNWTVDVNWEGSAGLDGRAVCLWSDANDPTTIPAWEEVMRFMPRWSIATKLSDGLVEGFKLFKL